MAGRPELSRTAMSWLLAVVTAYVLVSAFAVGTLTDQGQFFRLLEAFGLLPFAVFLVAPAVFANRRERDALHAAVVVLGLYLGMTALFETTGPDWAVYPAYINDPTLGIHFGRARGPFLEAVTNGFGLYFCAIMAAGAVMRWRSLPARLFAAGVCVLCVAGAMFTLQRSVWLGTLLATLFVLALRPSVRRHAVTVLVGGAVAAAVAYAMLPAGQLQERVGDTETVYARQSLNQTGLNVWATSPLVGVGWGQFVPLTQNGDFFAIGEDFPIAGVGNVLHNQFLSNAVELGLIGAALWLLAVFIALLGGLRRPVAGASDDVDLWQSALLAFGVFFVVVSLFIPTHLWPNLVFWMLAGVTWAARGTPAGREPRR
jgi:O-antigen ligase